MILSQKRKDVNLQVVDCQMTDALQITINVHVDELQKWDSNAYKFMQLLSFLPAFCSESDLENYWQEWKKVGDKKFSDFTEVSEIVDKLLKTGMVKLEEQ